MIIRTFTATATAALQPLYDSREANAIVKLYLQTKLRMPAHELALRVFEELTPAQESEFMADLKLLSEGSPLQYVLGETEFYGHRFVVSPVVLIPRPETEELVLQVCERMKHLTKIAIWDVGTGSGCIAISLAKELPNAALYASDISHEALEVARANAELLGVDVVFAQHDMRDIDNLPFPNVTFDVLVSNPPYIPESDRSNLHLNVRGFEPETALFVPDTDPLCFYEALAEIGKRKLNPGGLLAVETYEDFHGELTQLFSRYGYKNIVSLEDINGKKRMMTAQWNG